ncbi:MAG: hypothetical protein CMB54_03165 [Euryarchaeota archaeon]|nr:hypothetical protein [Euryarchaeota archaeon]
MEAFSACSESIRNAARHLLDNPSLSVTLRAPLTISGCIALSMIESALIDLGRPYSRRFAPSSVDNSGIFIDILDDYDADIIWNSDEAILTLNPMIVHALDGHKGDGRHGRLSPVATAASLMEELSPDGARSVRLLPFSIAGNWLHDAMDRTYDPVFTIMRDHLHQIGRINVVPLPEVPDPSVKMLPELDPFLLEGLTLGWSKMDIEDQARSLSTYFLPLLSSERPSTPRIEELGWHRVLAPDWSRDLASQLHDISDEWNHSGEVRLFASRTVDGLVRTGRFE